MRKSNEKSVKMWIVEGVGRKTHLLAVNPTPRETISGPPRVLCNGNRFADVQSPANRSSLSQVLTRRKKLLYNPIL